MTVFCLPDGRPFFAGTYFPKVTRGNHLGFPELCRRIDELWRDRRSDLEEQAESVTEAIASGDQLSPGRPGAGHRGASTPPWPLLVGQADRRDGGFGRAPKFPQTMALDTLLRHHRPNGRRRSPRRRPRRPSTPWPPAGSTTTSGGGFARYSTDSRWLVPHFEKMLYDQALLARVYLHAWQVTGEPRFRQVLDETVDYVLRDLRHPAGGLLRRGGRRLRRAWRASSTSGPSTSVRRVAGTEADAAIDWYGVTEGGNFEGTNILDRPVRGDLAPPAEVERARRRCSTPATQRVRPGLDDKVLTEWNGLMLAALAEAAAATSDDDLAGGRRGQPPSSCCAHLRRDDGRWLRSWQGPTTPGPMPARPSTWPTPPTTVRWSTPSCRLAEATGDARWIDEARPDGRRADRAVLGRRAPVACSPPAPTPRPWSPDPRT